MSMKIEAFKTGNPAILSRRDWFLGGYLSGTESLFHLHIIALFAKYTKKIEARLIFLWASKLKYIAENHPEDKIDCQTVTPRIMPKSLFVSHYNYSPAFFKAGAGLTSVYKRF